MAIPVLPQRRRSPRYALLQPCKAILRGVPYSAFTHDVSKNGIGIECRFPLKLKEPVVIELHNGRRLPARIVWHKENRYGLQFESQLENNDPLLFG